MKNIITATNYTSQLAEALRQQKQAEAMQEQANAPIEIQSYKGVQAPIPWTALLAKGLGVVGSKVKEGRALKRQGELEKFKTEETQRQIANLLAPVAVGEQPGFRPMSNGSQLASALASANAPANVAGMAPTAGAGGMPGAAPNADLAAALGGAGRLSAGGPPGVSMNGPAPGGMPMMPTQAMPPVRPAPMGAPLAPIQTAAPMAATTRSANSQEMTQRAAEAMTSPFAEVKALGVNTLERAQGLEDEQRKLEQAETQRDKQAARMKEMFGETAPAGTSKQAWNAALYSGNPAEIAKIAQTAYDNADTKPKVTDDMANYNYQVAHDGYKGSFGEWTVEQANLKTPRTTTNVNVTNNSKGEGAYATTVGEGLGKQDLGRIAAAQNAPTQIETANRILSTLDNKKLITGFGADFKLQFARAFGGDKATIADTQNLASDLAQQTLDHVKASGLGANQGFTDKDLRFLQDAKSGRINLTPENLRYIANKNKQAAKYSITKGNEAIGRLRKSPTFSGNTGLPDLVTMPEEPSGNAPPPPPGFKINR